MADTTTSTTTPPAAPAPAAAATAKAASPAPGATSSKAATKASPKAATLSPKTASAAPKSGKTHFVHTDPQFNSVCRWFVNRKCTRGAACSYVHDPQLCVQFFRTGACKFGDECKKNHFVTVTKKNEGGGDATTAAGDAAHTAKERKSKKPKDTKKKIEGESADTKPKSANKNNDSAATTKKTDTAAHATHTEHGKKNSARTKKASKHKTKKNTENFNPMTDPVDLRVTLDLGTHTDTFSTTPLTSRDVLLAPNIFSDFAKGQLYAQLVSEIENCGIPHEKLLKLWHGNDKIDGTHLIADDKLAWKRACPTFDLVIDRITAFFNLSVKATRFNWYKDTAQWKPFHFDAAAVKPEIAAKQNFTVGISFGATRDAAFEHAATKAVVSIPQPDGCVYAFARDTNVLWRHGILQDTPVRADGRISIIAWGWIDHMVDAAPPQQHVAAAVEEAVTATS